MSLRDDDLVGVVWRRVPFDLTRVEVVSTTALAAHIAAVDMDGDRWRVARVLDLVNVTGGRDKVRSATLFGVVDADLLQPSGLLVRAVVHAPVACLFLPAVNETKHAPTEMIVDGCALPRTPAEGDHGKHGTTAVEAVLPVAGGYSRFTRGRLPVFVFEPTQIPARDQSLNERFEPRHDRSLVALGCCNSLEVLDEVIEHV